MPRSDVAVPPVSVAREREGQRLHPPVTGHWPHATALALCILATVGIRVHESIALLVAIRPLAIATYGGALLLLVKSSPAALRSAVRDRTAVLTIAYSAWMFATVPFALWPSLALGAAQASIPTFILVFSVLLCETDARRVRMLSFGLVVLSAVLGLEAILLGGTSSGQGLDRLSTSGSFDPNDLAAIMAMSVPFAVAGALRDRGARRLVGFAAAALFAAVIVRTGSRGGTIALLAGALIVVCGFPGGRKFLLLGCLTAALAGGWSLTSPAFQARMLGISSMESDYNYTDYGGRKQIWERARGYIAEHPISGVGAGNFGVAEGEHGAALGIRVPWLTTHNAYLQATAELGFVGGFLFVGLLLTSMYRAWPLWRPRAARDGTHQPEFFASLCAFATSSYFLSHAYFVTFFAICALTALADRARRARAPVAETYTPQARMSGWRTARFAPPRVVSSGRR